MKKSELAAGKVGRPRRPEHSITEQLRNKTLQATVGRSPRATTWSQFFDGHLAGRDPGQWPSLLQRAWAPRENQQTYPAPLGPDNMQNRGARASQYSR